MGPENGDQKMIAELFGVQPGDIKRPTQGEIGLLIGQQAASFHPVRRKAVSNLVLMENDF
jgi:hypothetical protein